MAIDLLVSYFLHMNHIHNLESFYVSNIKFSQTICGEKPDLQIFNSWQNLTFKYERSKVLEIFVKVYKIQALLFYCWI